MIGQTLDKITFKSIKNSGSTLILSNSVTVHPRNIHAKIKANPCSGMREVKKAHDNDNNKGDNKNNDEKENRHRIIARVTLTH